MSNLALTFLVVILSLVNQVENQPATLGSCNCNNFSCGSTGYSNGLTCWYPCCWMTMGIRKTKMRKLLRNKS